VLLAATWGRHLSGAIVPVVLVALVAAVLTAVHHAEVIAHRVGEPFGTLILALSVTVIEAGLIITLMIAEPDKSAALARDTVFAAVMIVCNGVVGISLLVGALRHRIVSFQADGTTGAFAALTALATLSLVLPSFTSSTPGPTFTGAQLGFAAVASFLLYGAFVLTQTIQHREMFLPTTDDAATSAPEHPTGSIRESTGLLPVSLVAVVGLAKVLSPTIEDGVRSIGAPQAVVGVVIAMVVLLPESISSVRAANRNDLQTSMNLSLGSGLASIGLTIPAIAVASIWLDGPIVLGLGPKEIVLFALTVAVGILTFARGQAIPLQGAIHLVIFAGFVFLAIRP